MRASGSTPRRRRRSAPACVAVAHTRDDQAETVLLRLVRGAGPAGLSGMAPRRDHLVRPLLEVSRAELRAFLDEIGEPWREDATNADRAIPRNRFATNVLPQLRELNAQADAALARAADILQDRRGVSRWSCQRSGGPARQN